MKVNQNFSLTVDTVLKLKEAAKRKGKSMSSIIENLIVENLKNI